MKSVFPDEEYVSVHKNQDPKDLEIEETKE
jgi:hypothetical protein